MSSQTTTMTEERPARFGALVGASQAMQSVFEQVRRVARTDATVLIVGESGTGKDLVAAAIHSHSPRRAGPFSMINMAAIPESLVESELFGHVKGAFTGAGQDRVGWFEASEGGTLFIDEIGDLVLTSQAKLLHVLENRWITPVGGNNTCQIDVRVLAATNRPLESLVGEKRFREDLYYRLNVLSIALPPLRERREDIPLLANHFLEEIAAVYGQPPPTLSDELKQFLLDHEWPGNVRQLRNAIESMVVLTDSRLLTIDDLPPTVCGHPEMGPELPEIPPNLTLEEVEKTAILQSLDRCRGNRTQAARALDISVRTLQRKLKQWGISSLPTHGTKGRPAIGPTSPVGA